MGFLHTHSLVVALYRFRDVHIGRVQRKAITLRQIFDSELSRRTRVRVQRSQHPVEPGGDELRGAALIRNLSMALPCGS